MFSCFWGLNVARYAQHTELCIARILYMDLRNLGFLYGEGNCLSIRRADIWRKTVTTALQRQAGRDQGPSAG